MSARPQAELPDLAEILGALLQRVPERERPLLVALAERMAAERYRGWAARSDDATAAALRACARREEEIARRVEALFPDARATQQRIRAENPDLEQVNRTLFEGRPLDEQFTIQARGERLGAATWRSLAEKAEREDARETFLGCALLEEESASFLESLRPGTG